MKKIRTILFLFFTLIGSHSGAFSVDPQELDRFIEQSRLEENVPGVAISIVSGDKIIVAKGYGFCRYGRPEKVDENTIFQIGSVSKTFASAGLGIQVDKKRLRWDDEVIRYLPRFALKDPYPSRFATSRDLLAHRTGLPAFRGDLLGRLGYSSEEVLFRVRLIDPGDSFRNKALYSNVGFFVAGQLLVKLASASWEEAIQTTLLDPLKMKRTGFSTNLGQPNVAFPHAIVNGRPEVIPWDIGRQFVAAGGVTSTAADMGNWMMMQLNGGVFEGSQILKPETVKEMHAPSMVAEVSFTELPPITEASNFCYGLGWNSFYYNGRQVLEKGGALEGVRAVVTLIPDLKVGITILANLNLTILPEIIRARFLEIYLGPYDGDLKGSFEKAREEIDKATKLPERPKDALPLPRSLSRFAGTFISELYGAFDISEENNGLVVHAGPGRWPGRLVHWSNDTFILEWTDLWREFVTFTFGPDGEAIGIQTETLGAFSRL